MFWGLVVENGRRYHQIVEFSFHISKAVGKSLQTGTYELVIRHNKQDFIVCILDHVDNKQQNLDLNFTEGEEIEIFLNNPNDPTNGAVCLTGYYQTPSLATITQTSTRSSKRTAAAASYLNGHTEDVESGTSRKRTIGDVNGGEGEDSGGLEGEGVPVEEETEAGPSSGKVAKKGKGVSSNGGGGTGASLADMITKLASGECEDEEDDEDFEAGEDDEEEDEDKEGELDEDDNEGDEEDEDNDDDEDEDDGEEDLDEDELAGLKEDMDMSLTDLKVPRPSPQVKTVAEPQSSATEKKKKDKKK